MSETLSRRSLFQAAASGAPLLSILEAQSPASAAALPPRIRESFDFGWRFQKGDTPGAQQPAFADNAWRTLDLPHDWSVEGPFDQNAPTSGAGGYLPAGIAWYRKSFEVPAGWAGRTVAIEFDGVYENSEVWINGQYLGKRPFGYISFAYDLTPHLRRGASNVVAVKVDNSRQPNSRWYSGSGIYRHTWLVATDPLHVARCGTFVTTPEINSDWATVRVKTQVENAQPGAQACTLQSAILDASGRTLATLDATQTVSGSYEFSQDLKLEKPGLWSVETPTLYTLRSTLSAGGSVRDVYETPFGVRDARFDADKGFLLNGRPVKLNGVCVHHDGGGVGAAVPERIWQRRLELLRQMGCNAIRMSHNPPAPELLDLCDRMGFLVMDEAFDEWHVPKGQIGPFGYHLYFDEWSERDVNDFVRRDRNHPSVVLWSAGNEIGDQVDDRGSETARRLVSLFHRADPTRLVTAACDNIAAEPRSTPPEFLDSLDVVGYNYVDRWRTRIETYCTTERHAYPRRRIIGTENRSLGGLRGDPLTAMRGRALDVEQLWKFVRVNDYFSGDFMWTGIDHLGEARWPNRSSSSGVIDTCGFPKEGFYFYQSQWNPAPMLHLFPHWNWAGREGQVIPVQCFSNCDTVELFLNGRSFGIKGYLFPRLGAEGGWNTYPPRARLARTTSDLHLAWDVPYEPGTLKAVGTKDGKVVCTVEIPTVDAPSAVRLSADRHRLAADRRDVVHLTAQVVDAKGRPVPHAANEITFRLDGPCRLLATDNGNPASHADFRNPAVKLYQGLCLAIVQSTASPGTIAVQASSPGLQPASLSLQSAV